MVTKLSLDYPQRNANMLLKLLQITFSNISLSLYFFLKKVTNFFRV